MKRIAIMQPYFLPYLGYWQLMNCVDQFVVYDDIQFTKKGWIHRNRYLCNAKQQMFTLPLKKASDYLNVRDRELSDSWDKEKLKLLRKIEGAYRRAPFLNDGMFILRECINAETSNLFEFIYHSIALVKRELEIETPLIVSSELGDTQFLSGQARVLEICKMVGATEYVNPIGGLNLYDSQSFSEVGVSLLIHKIHNIKYAQFDDEFNPNLSVLDCVMFNGLEATGKYLSCYDLI